MTIPFIHLYPNGRRALTNVDRPDNVEESARKFIAHGGEYHIGILKDGQAKVQAVMVAEDGSAREGDAELCENGPALLEVVDRVIRVSQIMLTVLVLQIYNRGI